MASNREHLENWQRTAPHTWLEQYNDYRYWSNGRLVSLILATLSWLKERGNNGEKT